VVALRCNTFTKFRDLVRKADALECDWIATGHYARAINGELHRGLDPNKDQTYFLWGIEHAVVQRLLLPVGHQTKAETRALAHSLGLEVIAEKTESQDICFVPDGDHITIIRRERGDDAPALQRGPFLLEDGTPVGEHDGYARFTIGQRKGVPGGFASPMFVVAIEPATRAVVLGPRESLLGRGLIARGMHWMTAEPLGVGARVLVQHRHRATPAPAEIVRLDGDEIELALDAPLSAITPGQSMVLYDGTRVLGGGFIESGVAALPRRTTLPILATV
jgi:tRNA-uridine 2-sulfurtransferase